MYIFIWIFIYYFTVTDTPIISGQIPHRSCVHVQLAGSSTEALLPPVEQDRHDDIWLVHSPCCHDNGLPPKPCISTISPWSARAKRRKARQRKKKKQTWISTYETCSSNHLKKIFCSLPTCISIHKNCDFFSDLITTGLSSTMTQLRYRSILILLYAFAYFCEVQKSKTSNENAAMPWNIITKYFFKLWEFLKIS